ncbi:MAG TPA: YXWGXW repeat-containing protein [Acidobacteriaceae bacterium]|nr:YXWGXW repeat-containing protein [Acidobacteriaceae bacterium]
MFQPATPNLRDSSTRPSGSVAARRSTIQFSHHLRRLLIAAAVAVPLFALPAAQAQISIGVSFNIGIAPPPLPVYVQPAIPGDGYIWTPGYWAYGDAGYFWVPGTWVLAPQPGYLWTPGYWGYEGGYYGWHQGYWGPQIGYYGGVNYGFGYGGIGFYGGEWRGNHFFYNSAVVNFNGGWHPDHDRVYVDRDVVVHNTIVNVNHVSYNGPGGIDRQPTPQERQYSNGPHLQPTSAQMEHQNYAAQDRSQLAAVNHGRPATVAAANPAAYHQVAQQHAVAQPISAADRSTGKTYNPNTRQANQDQRNGGTANQPHVDQQVHNYSSAPNNQQQQQPQQQQPQQHQQPNQQQNHSSQPHNNPAPKPQPQQHN